jgi:hypothetical protein
MTGDEMWVHNFIPQAKQSEMKFGPLKKRLGRRRLLHNNDEWKWFVVSFRECKTPIFAAAEFLNSFQVFK